MKPMKESNLYARIEPVVQAAVLFCDVAEIAGTYLQKFTPLSQVFSESWADEKLYAKYGIAKSEQQFIESLIKPKE